MADDELWTDQEFEAAAEAYLAMLRRQQLGESFSKAEVSRSYRDGPLKGRSKQSFDYRMRNISAVLQEDGRLWLQGFVPAEHVGEPFKRRIRAALATMEARGVPILAPSASGGSGVSADSPAGARRVWLKAFWGFRPGDDGYLGFTRPADRERLIAEYRPGDLVLIYGADAPETERKDRKQALGFLEIDPVRVTDRERSSDAGWERKVRRGFEGRWNNAVPVRRAWEVQRRIDVRNIAPDTYVPARARVIASRGELLTDDESFLALQLPVTVVDVFGEPPIMAETVPEATMASAFAPSRGLVPTFGGRESQYEDGPSHLYMLVFEGDAAALLGRAVGRLIVVKVGYSNSPERRCQEHNATLPPAATTRWRLWLRSKAFPSGEEAKAAEDAMKADFAKLFQSLGGEFFLGPPAELESAFCSASRGAAFVIRGAPVRSRR